MSTMENGTKAKRPMSMINGQQNHFRIVHRFPTSVLSLGGNSYNNSNNTGGRLFFPKSQKSRFFDCLQSSDSKDLVSFLEENPGFDCRVCDRDGNNPIWLVVKDRNQTNLQILLRHLREGNFHSSTANSKKKKEHDDLTKWNHPWNDPLYLATKFSYQRQTLALQLIEFGFEAETIDSDGYSALTWAIANQCESVLVYFLLHGANLRQIDRQLLETAKFSAQVKACAKNPHPLFISSAKIIRRAVNSNIDQLNNLPISNIVKLKMTAIN